MRHAVLYFASIGRRSKIDKQAPCGVDHERMHGMVTGERKARYDRLGFFTRNDFAIFQWIADDAIVDLGVERALIERDSGSAAPTFGNRLSEAARSLLTLPPVTTSDMPAMLPAIVMSIVTLVVVTRIGACVRLLVGAGIRLLILALVRSLIIWPHMAARIGVPDRRIATKTAQTHFLRCKRPTRQRLPSP